MSVLIAFSVTPLGVGEDVGRVVAEGVRHPRSGPLCADRSRPATTKSALDGSAAVFQGGVQCGLHLGAGDDPLASGVPGGDSPDCDAQVSGEPAHAQTQGLA
jgi:hypothetical protein